MDRPRVAVAADGSLAAIYDGTRIVVAALPTCAPFATVDCDPDASDTELAWIGTPPCLLVLSRFAAHAVARLIDPFGSRTIGTLQLDDPMKLHASVGSHALVIGDQGALVLTATDDGITGHLFPARTIPVTAGAAGAQFAVALPGAIEEWDPVSRLSKRHHKVARQPHVTAVGGNERVVWMTSQQEPSKIQVIQRAQRGQPTVHELPEPVGAVASHPQSDILACIGATTGQVWVIDLAGHDGPRPLELDGIDHAEAIALVHGSAVGVLVGQRQRPIAMVTLQPAAEPATLAIPPKPTTPPGKRAGTKPGLPAAPRARTSSSRLEHPEVANFRDRVKNPRARTAEPAVTLWANAAPDWREIIVMWTREAMTAPVTDAPVCVPIDLIVARFGLSPQLTHAIMLLYGAHLIGVDGVAPIGIAELAGWAEALGRGELADQGVARYRASRVHLAPAILRALDELPPTTGQIVGTPGVVSLLGPCVIVADGPLQIVAEAWMSSVGGAILAARADADPHELVIEARAYGAAPMVRIRGTMLATIPVDQPVILVADDEAMADGLGLRRLT